MKQEQAVYILERFPDDPRYRGFIGDMAYMRLFASNGLPEKRWTPKRMAPSWSIPNVTGKVRAWNDFPCVNLVHPAFSARAVGVLRSFLEPNGEILPLDTPSGEYYAYNVTTVADVLDTVNSKVKWLGTKEIPIAIKVDRYVFFEDKLSDLSIFKIPESANTKFVTQRFVDRVREYGLRGFNFKKVWPLPSGTHWRTLAHEKQEQEKARDLAPGKTLKGNSVIINLILSSEQSNGSVAERKAVKRILDELDEILIDATSEAPAVGNVEGDDFGVPGECRIFLSCPDADELIDKLRGWFRFLDWPQNVWVTKRYGTYVDGNAREVVVKGLR